MRQLAFVLVLVLVTAGLAGCMGDDGSSQSAGTQSSANDTSPSLSDPDVSIDGAGEAYSYEAETRSEVRWENDSFAPASCFACPNSAHRYDVTGLLATQAPTFLEVEVRTSPTFIDAVGVYLDPEGAEVYQHNASFQSFSAIVAPHGGSLEVVVYNTFPDADTEISYELRIQAVVNQTHVPAEVPVEIPEPTSPQALVVDDVDLEGSARLMLWDGEDRFLGHHSIDGRTTINVSEAEGGPLVGYLAGTDGNASLAPVNASASETTMRALDQALMEATESIASNEVVEVQAAVDRVPLQTALALYGDFDAGTQYSGILEAGNNTLVSFESGGYLSGPDSRFSWWSQAGAPELVAGDYVGTFEFSAATGGEAAVLWLTYQR